MSDEIVPVMTQEEWAEVRRNEPRYHLSHLGDGIDIIRDNRADGDATLPLVLAVANDALPVDHPLKITREDVDALLTVVEKDPQDEMANEGDGYVEVWQSEEMRYSLSMLARLAKKLAALLPPKG